MATVTYPVPPSAVMMGGGQFGQDQPKVAYFPEASSQSFAAGSCVYLASGVLTACSTGAIDTSSTILGIALEDASGTAGTLIAVAVIDPGRVYLLPVTTTATPTTPPANSAIGTSYAGRLVSGYGLCMDKNNTTNPVMKFMGSAPQDGYSTSDSGILVKVQFLATAGVGF